MSKRESRPYFRARHVFPGRLDLYKYRVEINITTNMMSDFFPENFMLKWSRADTWNSLK